MAVELLVQHIALLEELEHEAGHNNRRRLRNRGNPFDDLNETQFLKLFRLSKALAQFLIEILRPHLRSEKRPTDLDICTKV